MDLADLIASIAQIPGIGPYMVWISFALTTTVTLASIASTQMHAPTKQSGAYFWLYTIVHYAALLKGHAQSLSAPPSTDIVGGPGAITAPRLSIASVPLDGIKGGDQLP